jgi:hypothetical protein
MSAHGATSSRMLSSIPTNAGMVAGVLRLLARLDDLPWGATGALHFGDQGLILLQGRKICWAVARSMRLRLTDILRSQSTPPLPREAVEALYRSCRQSGKPIGEALVASGLVSEQGLRAALFKHNGEAIVALANSGALPDSFVVHSKTGYDPKFAFSSCEVLAMLGFAEDPARAAAAQLELGSVLVEDSAGAAFARSSAVAGALLIAVDRGCEVAAADLVELCNWVAGMFDVARIADPQIFAARVAWGRSAAVVTWRAKDVGFVGLCRSRPAAARLLAKLAERGSRESGVMAALPGRGGAP